MTISALSRVRRFWRHLKRNDEERWLWANVKRSMPISSRPIIFKRTKCQIINKSPSK